jgi:hypothetical protein
MTGVPPPLSARDRLEEALARIADPNGEGSRACLGTRSANKVKPRISDSQMAAWIASA